MPLKFTTLDATSDSSPPGQGMSPFAIESDQLPGNNEFVGIFVDGTGTHGFYFVAGAAAYNNLPQVAGATPVPYGVNDLHQIVGSYVSGGSHGFLYSGGSYTPIDDPSAGPSGTIAYGVNHVGQIVGSYVDTGGVTHGFLDVSGSFSTIDVPGSTFTEVRGINAAGIMVGDYRDSGGAAHGFIDIGGSFTILDDPLATSGTFAYGLNDHNQVVGEYGVGAVAHGFVWSNGIFTTIDDPIPSLAGTKAYGITNDGRIIGAATTTSGVMHGFLTSPMHVAPDDYDGDNRSDLLFRLSSGALFVAPAPGSTAIGPVVTLGGNAVAPDSSWSAVGFGDFSFDGTADVLWRQNGGGLALWQMQGSVITTSSNVTYLGSAVMPDASWSVAGTSDFSGDGMTDVLWRQSGGALLLWQMNGAAITSSSGVTNQGNAIAPDPSWTTAGTGDFSGDGKADVLWRQSSGALAVWQMDGSVVSQSIAVNSDGTAVTPDASWSLAGIGDFDGDGRADMLWRQASSGSVVEWSMNGGNILSTGATTSHGSVVAPDASWSAIEIGDFNNDGNADLLWRQNSTGTTAEWLMSGSTIISSTVALFDPNLSQLGVQALTKPTSFI